MDPWFAGDRDGGAGATVGGATATGGGAVTGGGAAEDSPEGGAGASASASATAPWVPDALAPDAHEAAASVEMAAHPAKIRRIFRCMAYGARAIRNRSKPRTIFCGRLPLP